MRRSTVAWRPERQLGLLWGGVAILLIALAPVASQWVSALPVCPLQSLAGLPCPTCGSTRAALAIARLDLADALRASPLAAVAWLALVGGGMVAGMLALLGAPLREPDWSSCRLFRWSLVAAVAANWVYLVVMSA